MQAYPVYTIQGTGPLETGVTIEVRLVFDAGGGLSGAKTEDAVAKVLAAALAGAGASAVLVSKVTQMSGPVALA